MSSRELTVDGLRVRYGKATAVDGVSLTVPSGIVTAVVGPNGAGKSSLLLALYGSVPADGSVRLGGEGITQHSVIERAKRGLAMVPQGRQLFPRMTVVENMRLFADLLRLPPAAVDEALDRFPILRERGRSLAGVLSGGEQQMLVVSRALMTEPSVLLLDEMMTGLAPKIVQQLTESVAALVSDGVAVLIADPSLAPIRGLVDRGYVMVRGRIVDEQSDADALDQAYQGAMGVIRDEVGAHR